VHFVKQAVGTTSATTCSIPWSIGYVAMPRARKSVAAALLNLVVTSGEPRVGEDEVEVGEWRDGVLAPP
jgi:hypothetical protein